MTRWIKPNTAVIMIEIDIAVEDEGWATCDALLQEAIQAVCDEIGYTTPAGVSVLLTNDAEIQILNRDFRGKDSPTNVLSFPAEDIPRPEGVPVALGDIALARETIEREADAASRPFEHHVKHLIIHGVLHLLGYDHETDDEAGLMESTEIKALSRLGIEDPYRVPVAERP